MKTTATSQFITTVSNGVYRISPRRNRKCLIIGSLNGALLRVSYGQPSPGGVYGLYVGGYVPYFKLTREEVGSVIDDEWCVGDAAGSAGTTIYYIDIAEAP